MSFYTRLTRVLIFTLIILCKEASAQLAPCTSIDTIVYIDFGTANNFHGNEIIKFGNYRKDENNYPRGGHFIFSPITYHGYSGRWITLTEDRTPGDEAGNMMLVNAAETPGDFLTFSAKKLQPGSYELSLYAINLFLSNVCTPIQPNFKFVVQTPNGKVLAKHNTGTLQPQEQPAWLSYNIPFTLTNAETDIFVRLQNINPGGCANDFGIDDITLTACITPQITKAEQQEEKAFIQKDTLKKLPPAVNPLTKRMNPIVKKIETDSAELLIELYDNGEIDGDTVSVYHNNKLILSRAQVSARPITLRIKVDKDQPHHELVMVAENLGSIPPNTALLIINANGKKYETFISTDQQKNAKLIIELKR